MMYNIKLKDKKPRTVKEFKKLTKKYFGKQLDIEKFWINEYGTEIEYKIKNKHGNYGYTKTAKKWKKKFKDSTYSLESAVMAWAFGELFCGGIARSNYGQSQVVSHAESERIKEFYADWKRLERRQGKHQSPERRKKK